MNNNNNNNSIKTVESITLSEIIATNKKIKFGLCHGGFDLLHPGHIEHFESASKLCDKLIVSITCDKYVKERKGVNRPIFNENQRAYMIASLEYIDFVVISPYRTGIEIIEELKPTFYIKGPDYKNKQSTGIKNEIKTIQSVGGEILYTDDEKFSTSNLIDKISSICRPKFLLILDRDGTLIEEKEFLGKENDWKDNIILNRPVIDFIHTLSQNYNLTTIVITNQAGVAWDFFDTNRVIEINRIIEERLLKEGISVQDWQFSPYVDKNYAIDKGLKKFNSDFIVEKSNRKPSKEMVESSLHNLKLNISNFENILVLGDRQDDKNLAKNLKCKFINVEKRSLSEIKKEFNSL